MKEIRRIVEEIDTVQAPGTRRSGHRRAVCQQSVRRWAWNGSRGAPRTGPGLLGGSLIGTDPTSGRRALPLASGLASATATTTTTTSGTAASALGALKSGLNIGVIGQSITFGGVTFPNVQAFIQALATDNKANILSTPQLLTLNNEEAEVIVGSNIPYTTSVRLDSSGNPITNFDYRDVGVHLKGKAIHQQGWARLPQHIHRGDHGRVDGGNCGVDDANRADHQQEVHQDDRRGEGQSDDRHQRHHTGQYAGSRQGIPLLRSIPVIGQLFGYYSKSFTRTNLLVFLTPRIIYDAETLQKISDKLKVGAGETPDTSRNKVMESLAALEEDLAPVPNRIASIHHSFFQKNNLVPLGMRNDPPALLVAVCEGENGTHSDILSIFSEHAGGEEVCAQEGVSGVPEYLQRGTGQRSRDRRGGGLGESALTEIAQEIPSGHDLLDDAANEPPLLSWSTCFFPLRQRTGRVISTSSLWRKTFASDIG